MADLNAVFYTSVNTLADGTVLSSNSSKFDVIHPSFNSVYRQFLVANGKRGLTIRDNSYIKLVDADSVHRVFGSKEDFVISDLQTRLDSGTSFSAGKDYYIYLVQDATGAGANIVVSLNATYPSGSDSYQSRKIGGFHTICANIGTISGHPLSGYSAGDILPMSVWDLGHRAVCDNAGMTYCEEAHIWVDIYLQSGTGTSTKSVFGGTITDTRTYTDHAEDMFMVGKRPLSDHEFRAIAEGSNYGTVINGAADPVTTGGHVDTAGRRCVSNCGCEDCCGVQWQWLRDLSAIGLVLKSDGTTDTGGMRVGYGGNGLETKGYSYYVHAPIAGGHWDNTASSCGPRYRSGTYSVLHAPAGITCRGSAAAWASPCC